MTALSRLAAGALLALAATPVLADDVTYDLINNSSAALTEFYTSPTSDPNWSEDFLANEDLPAGQSGTVTLYGASEVCSYDVRFVFDDGSELTDQVDVCTLASYTLSDAQ